MNIVTKYQSDRERDVKSDRKKVKFNMKTVRALLVAVILPTILTISNNTNFADAEC